MGPRWERASSDDLMKAFLLSVTASTNQLTISLDRSESMILQTRGEGAGSGQRAALGGPLGQDPYLVRTDGAVVRESRVQKSVRSRTSSLDSSSLATSRALKDVSVCM